jgi:hypothetical protein
LIGSNDLAKRQSNRASDARCQSRSRDMPTEKLSSYQTPSLWHEGFGIHWEHEPGTNERLAAKFRDPSNGTGSLSKICSGISLPVPVDKTCPADGVCGLPHRPRLFQGAVAPSCLVALYAITTRSTFAKPGLRHRNRYPDQR